MARNRVTQHPEEYREDLNPEYEEGENTGPRRYETRPAEEIKELHELYPELTNADLKRIPVLVAHSRLEQGATYLDLRFPQRGEFKGMDRMETGPDDWFVSKRDIDHELWNRLIGPRAVPIWP